MYEKSMFIDDLDMKYHSPYKYTALNTSCREMIALMSFSRVYTHNARPGKNSSWPALTGTLHKLRRNSILLHSGICTKYLSYCLVQSVSTLFSHAFHTSSPLMKGRRTEFLDYTLIEKGGVDHRINALYRL